MQISKLIYSSVLAVVVGATSALANEPIMRNDSTTLWFENWGGLTNGALVVSSPDGAQTDIMAEKGSPKFSLKELESVKDGVYSFELSAAMEKMVKVNTEINNGRGKAQRDSKRKSFYMRGHFFVVRGAISTEEISIKEEDSDKK